MGLKDLPLDNGQNIARVFERFGWVPHRGKNHIVLTHPNQPPQLNISIPDHKEVSRSLLHAQIRRAGLTDEIFLEAYKSL